MAGIIAAKSTHVNWEPFYPACCFQISSLPGYCSCRNAALKLGVVTARIDNDKYGIANGMS
jgi:hypothetical protein